MEFLQSYEFLVPFLSTLMAALAVIFIQFVFRFIDEKKKKLYATEYIVDVLQKVLFSNCFLKAKTVLPHIRAMERVLDGEVSLLQTMFDNDDIDILTDQIEHFYGLTEEHKILIGLDDLQLLQMFEKIICLEKNDSTIRPMNKFVKNNLKSIDDFNSLDVSQQQSCLTTYLNYLQRIDHSFTRTIFMITKTAKPRAEEYEKRKEFMLFSRKNIKSILSKIDEVIDEYKEIIPKDDFTKEMSEGGIQNQIKDGQTQKRPTQ